MSTLGSDMPAYAQLASGIRRLIAPNPSMMTGPGTNTYLFGKNDIAVLDPGPHIPEHAANILKKAGGNIRWILATHTHPDHSPGVMPLARITKAEVLGMAVPEGELQDSTFVPDRVLADGDKLETDEFVIEAVHTPGHASNHMCYRHVKTNWLFTGDHIIEGSTVVINPPDGDMAHYMESLDKVKALRLSALLPGHGELIDDPDGVIDWNGKRKYSRLSKSTRI